MSNKNKIAIVFEALGLDKVISSLSDFSKKLTSTEKSTKQTVKATEELDEETKKLGSSLQKASTDISKADTSTKKLNDTNKESKKTTEDLDSSIKNQTKNYKDLAKQLEEQKKARNSLVEEALSKENKNIYELLNINHEYIDTLNKLKIATDDNISTNKQDIDSKKALAKELQNAKRATDELIDSVDNGTASVKKVKKSFEMLNPVMTAVRSGTNKVKVGFDALNKSSGGIMLVITGISKLGSLLGGAISKGKEFSEALDIQNKSIQGMSFAISKNNKLTFESNKSLMDFASELQSATAYGDEFTMGLIKQGTQANLNEEEIKRLTKVSLDLATATGIDANTAMKDLTVGLNDVAKLTKIAEDSFGGFTQAERTMLNELQSTGKQAEATAYALERIEKAVGGASQKEVETFAGKLQQMKNNWGDVYEEIGRATQALAKPFLAKASDAVVAMNKALKDPEVIDKVQKLVTALKVVGEVAFAVGKFVFDAGKSIGTAIAGIFVAVDEAVGGKLKDFGTKAVGFIMGLKDTMIEAYNIIEQFGKDLLSGKGFKEAVENAKKSGEEIKASFSSLFNAEENKKRGLEAFEEINKMHEETKKSWQEQFVIKVDTSTAVEENKKGLLQMLTDVEQVKAVEMDITQATFATSKKAVEDLQSIERKALEDRKKLLEDEVRERIKKGEDINTIYIDGVGNLRDELQKANKELDKFNKDTADKQAKLLETLKAKAGEMVSSIGSIASGISSLIQGSKKAQLESLDAYDEAIQRSKEAQILALEEVNAKKVELQAEEDNSYTERLESELQRSLEAGDILSANAIQNKLNEIDAEKRKKDEEKKLAEKKKEEEKKLADEKKKVEKETNFAIAQAEYNKAMAEHGNQVKLAEMEASKAKADAGITLAQGIASAAVGVATSVAQLGPIAGLALGLTTAAGIIGSVSSGVGAIKSASANLESVKGSPPTPPKFAYGTQGYSLKQGESAIVGEAGAEVVRNKGGMLEVQSTEATKRQGAGGDINVNLNVYGMTFNEAIEVIQEKVQETFINLKERSLNYAI